MSTKIAAVTDHYGNFVQSLGNWIKTEPKAVDRVKEKIGDLANRPDIDPVLCYVNSYLCGTDDTLGELKAVVGLLNPKLDVNKMAGRNGNYYIHALEDQVNLKNPNLATLKQYGFRDPKFLELRAIDADYDR